MRNSLPFIISIVIYIVFMFLFVFLLGVFIKHRSKLSAVMFAFFLSALCFFFLNYPVNTVTEIVGEVPTDKLPWAGKLLNFLPQYGVGPTLYSILEILSAPVRAIYVSFGLLLVSLLNDKANSVSFLMDPIFVLCFYAVLFVIFFLIFKKRKKKKKIYSDYDE